jgi:hypothetical protein
MASFNKFQNFVEDLCEKVHNLTSDQLEIYLSNTTPDAAADAVKADLAEIATGNGYTGPADTQNTGAEATGTYTLTGTAITITASGGSIAAFRYIVLQNTTPTSPLDPLIGYWDYGSALTLNDGDSFTWKPNNSASTGTILTVA